MMLRKRTLIGLMGLLLTQGMAFGAEAKIPAGEKQEFTQAIAQIRSIEKELSPGKENRIQDFERFADQLQGQWKFRSPEAYARLMLEICGPLSSGRFPDDRRYELARRYALSALAKPQEISLDTELELTGQVVTPMVGPGAPTGPQWEQARRKDVEVRLQVWKRLRDSIDPAWDPNEKLLGPNAVVPPAETELPAGVDPQAIEDPTLRARYERAIEANRQKLERYNEQYRVRKWLKRYPKSAEEYIVDAYARAPYNTAELAKYLEQYGIDEETTRMIDAVTERIRSQKETEGEDPVK